MIGTTLGDIRERVESLADPDGDYYLVCGRYGDRPVPADGLRFESRVVARAAARATEQYRAALRRYDPQVPQYDIIVCQAGAATRGQPVGTGAHGGPPDVDGRTGDRALVDFCHAVAGAVFETVADSDRDALEDAIMDTYLAAAETTEDPDELCLSLLESMAAELDARCRPAEQARLLSAAAARLPTPDAGADDPVAAALSRLESAALLEAYTVRPAEAADDARAWRVTMESYPLARPDGRVVTLPLVVELFRRRPAAGVAVDLAAAGQRCDLRLTAGDSSDSVAVAEVAP